MRPLSVRRRTFKPLNKRPRGLDPLQPSTIALVRRIIEESGPKDTTFDNPTFKAHVLVMLDELHRLKSQP